MGLLQYHKLKITARLGDDFIQIFSTKDCFEKTFIQKINSCKTASWHVKRNIVLVPRSQEKGEYNLPSQT